MGKGSSSVKETSAEKAAAGVAKEQWDLYKNELSQYEDIFMDKVDDLNSDQQYDKLAGTAALGSAQAFGEARQGLADNLAAGGVDPTSGKYQSAMDSLETNQALSQTDNTNRAQSSQQDKYVAGLKDVVSIGAGEKAEALAGYNSIANNSLSKAVNDAQVSQSNSAAMSGAVGTAAGMGLSHYMNMPKDIPEGEQSNGKAFTGSFG